MTDSPIEKPLLQLESMIGFNGGVPDGLKVHPNGSYLIYPVGCTIVIEEIGDDSKKHCQQGGKKRQYFLSGHTEKVTCLAVSRSGKYIASGQETHMGFKADVIIWDFDRKERYAQLTLHMVKVEAVAFSPNDMYLVSLGGMDDGSVVVWDIAKKEAICGSPAQVMSAGNTKTVCFANNDDNTFFTGGDTTLRIWDLDRENRKIRPREVAMSNKKRVIKVIACEPDDKFMYCGTSTGDILAVNSGSDRCQMIGPKECFSQGIMALKLLCNGDLLVGAGDGTVCIVKGMNQQFKRTGLVAKLKGAITSIAPRGKGHQFFVGTDQCNIYRFNHADFSHELVTTCHYDCVNDVVFPIHESRVFGTCSYQDIRLWNLNAGKELLRITVPNMTCNALEIMKDGKGIISGWDDGRIRAFYPESGKPMFTIEDAQTRGVSALATYNQCRQIISGGREGNVRIWKIDCKRVPKGFTFTTCLKCDLKEHKAEVTCIKIKKNDLQCVTSSLDGSCIIWDLVHECRNHMIRVNTLFKFVCYHPSEHQIITAGTDRKIGYWETYDGSTIRELDGSSGSINTMDISQCGCYFVSGGDDKLIKVWKYDEGEPLAIGVGHSASIMRVKISPARRNIVSVSSDGAILIWPFPDVPDDDQMQQQIQY